MGFFGCGTYFKFHKVANSLSEPVKFRVSSHLVRSACSSFVTVARCNSDLEATESQVRIDIAVLETVRK